MANCVLNYRTTRQDVVTLLDDVRRAAGQVLGCG
jgi:hypothetical protein